jgi:pimeloyl-ACP methyl ester carboxylesterase
VQSLVVNLRLPLWTRPLCTGLTLAACALLAAAAGCSYGITVRRADTPTLLDAWRASAVEAEEVSPRTMLTLRRLDLVSLHRRNPVGAYTRLHALAVQDPQPDFLFALAEICYLIGRQSEKCEDHGACAYYYLCAGYAYHYLFTAEEKERAAGPVGPSSFDPRFRLACDLYNTGLAKCIRAAQRIGRLDPRQQLQLPTPDGKGFTLSVIHQGFAWRPEEFGPLLFCSDYRVVGLDNHYRGYGLGVPLIATRPENVPDGVDRLPASSFYPRDVSFPVTAFFRFEGSVAELGAMRAGRLELYNPLTIQNIDVQGRTVPLETDLTTPLAYFLAHTDLEGLELTGFLRADKLRDRTGIYMFEPYQPGKIPVVMVHGLLSSPLTWAPMFNDLRSDPFLREHFQFWFYLYPTGNPYLATAADLRATMTRMRAELDPGRRDPALDQMVFVGHSMGGLVSKLLTLDSGDDFWRLVSPEPFDAIKAHPDTRAELEPIFFFERLPFVKRVVFLGTPHHGSKLSPSPPARLVTKFIRLPQTLLAASRDVAEENPDLWPHKGESKHFPTSVDLLAPGAPALELLASRPRPPGVHYHSIIGVVFGKGVDGSDGVVPYRSAHLDDVDSELVVPADHVHIHHHPRAVLEVRRILEEHLRAIEAEKQRAAAPARLGFCEAPAGK